MSGKRNIHINQMQIRLRGVSAEKARNATTGLGQEIMSQIGQGEQPKRSGMNLDNIEIPTVRVANGTQANDLRRILSEEIASAIEKSLVGTKSR